MRDAAIDPPDPREAELRRASDIQVMATTYESLRNAICMGLAPSMGILQEARSLRENMHQLKPKLVAENALPGEWESWEKLLDMFDRLWEYVKTSCTR